MGKTSRHYLIKGLLYLYCFYAFLTPSAYAQNEPCITLNLTQVKTADAVRILAKFLTLNVVLSPAIKGNVSLYLPCAQSAAAFQLLLEAQDLVQVKKSDVLYIAPRAEVVAKQVAAAKTSAAELAALPLNLRSWQIRYTKAADIAHLLQNNAATLLSARGSTRTDSRTNRLFVQDTAPQLALLARVIQQLDVPVAQLRINTRMVSVDHDFEQELGLRFSAHAPLGNLTLPTAHVFSLAVADLADGTYLDVALAAMENAGRGELISSPSLFTANQQTAAIEAGEEIPYQEESLSGGTAVTFKKAVLRLKVTPQILPGQQVLLQLQVNQDRPSRHIVQGVPTINTRLISTNVQVKSGHTLVLGGIYELNNENAEERVPFLDKIPGVGFLFKQQTKKISKRELLVFVTPEIIA